MSKSKSKINKKGWKDIPIGGKITKGGTARKFKTGNWKTLKPVRDEKKCIHCLKCFLYCPEGCIKVKDGKIVKIDYSYCKGCGICARECPVKAIKMVKE